MPLRYAEEIRFLKGYIPKLVEYSDSILDDIVNLYYVYRIPERIFMDRRSNKTPSSIVQSPRSNFDSVTKIGNGNLIEIFKSLDSENIFNSRTKNTKTQFNIVGKFKMLNEAGHQVIYAKGDVVYYEGKTYIATRETYGCAPPHKHPSCDAWEVIGLDDTVGYTERSF